MRAVDHDLKIAKALGLTIPPLLLLLRWGTSLNDATGGCVVDFHIKRDTA